MNCKRPSCTQPALATRGSFANHEPIWQKRRYCSRQCWELATSPTYLLCSNETCRKGDNGRRRLFVPRQKTQRGCCTACSNTQWQREQGWTRKKDTAALLRTDLTPDQIERKLASLARRRKETRSGLRITDAWVQRPGSEFHNVATGDWA